MVIRLTQKQAENLAYALLLQENGWKMPTVELRTNEKNGKLSLYRVEVDGTKEKFLNIWLSGGRERFREIKEREREEATSG